jgi:hypothetical protein
MPPVSSKYALKKMGEKKWEKVQAIARRFHWDCSDDLYPSEVNWLANTNTSEDLMAVVEDLYILRTLWDNKPKPHLKLIQGGA